MSVIKKLSVQKSSSSLPVLYDIGAEATNVNYDTETDIKTKIDSKQDTLEFDTVPTAQSTNPVTSNGIATAISTLRSNFQDGVDAIYNACVDKGSTPATHALDDVVTAIENIEGGGGGLNLQIPFVWNNSYFFDNLTEMNQGALANSGKYYLFIGVDDDNTQLQLRDSADYTQSQIGTNAGGGNACLSLYLITKNDDKIDQPVNAVFYYGNACQFLPLRKQPIIGTVVQDDDASGTFTLNFTTNVCMIAIVTKASSGQTNYSELKLINTPNKHYLCAYGTSNNSSFQYYQIFAIENNGTNQATITIHDSGSGSRNAYIAFPISFGDEIPYPTVPTQSTGSDEDITAIIDAYYDDTLTLQDIQSIQAVGDNRECSDELSGLQIASNIAPRVISPEDGGQATNYTIPKQENITQTIIDFDHDVSVNSISGHSKTLLTIQMKGQINFSFPESNYTQAGCMSIYNTEAASIDGQRGSVLRTYLNGNFYNAFGSLKNKIKQVVKQTCLYDSNVLYETNEYCFIPSYVEVFGSEEDSYKPHADEGSIYEYYIISTNRNKWPNQKGIEGHAGDSARRQQLRSNMYNQESTYYYVANAAPGRMGCSDSSGVSVTCCL